MSISSPSDEEILTELKRWGCGTMTYVVRNGLCSKYKGLKTSFVLRRMKALEAAGKVNRVPSPYKVQICWKLVAP